MGTKKGQAVASGCPVLAKGTVDPVTTWVDLSLHFEDMSLTPSIAGRPLTESPLKTQLASGGAAIGTNWHTAHFKRLRVEPTRLVNSDSWMLDVVPGNQKVHISGFAGMVLDLSNATAPLSVSALGRFKGEGKGRHRLTIVDASANLDSNVSLIPWDKLPQVD